MSKFLPFQLCLEGRASLEGCVWTSVLKEVYNIFSSAWACFEPRRKNEIVNSTT